AECAEFPVVNYEIVMINKKPRSKKDTKYVSAANEELTASNADAARLKLKLFKDAAAIAHAKKKWAMKSKRCFGRILGFLIKNIFPRLYALVINKHASVAAKFRDTLMSASFRRVPRRGLEEDQFHLLVDKVALVILFSIKDRWVWILDSGVEFSVKSARSYIDDYLL
nr:RNA-directed DNA polymerase, eukaryota [Tanacetum cinerariifolium]